MLQHNAKVDQYIHIRSGPLIFSCRTGAWIAILNLLLTARANSYIRSSIADQIGWILHLWIVTITPDICLEGMEIFWRTPAQQSIQKWRMWAPTCDFAALAPSTTQQGPSKIAVLQVWNAPDIWYIGCGESLVLPWPTVGVPFACRVKIEARCAHTVLQILAMAVRWGFKQTCFLGPQGLGQLGSSF